LFKGSNVKELTIISTETGSRADDDDSVEIIGSTSRKKIKTNPEAAPIANYYPFAAQVQSTPMMGMQNPFMMPQMPQMPQMPGMYGSYGMTSPYPGYCYPFGGSSLYNPYGNNPYGNTPFSNNVASMGQYPMFCGSYQPTISLDLFRQHG
jgi:hypothetical protein